jgi:hypothetical protein
MLPEAPPASSQNSHLSFYRPLFSMFPPSPLPAAETQNNHHPVDTQPWIYFTVNLKRQANLVWFGILTQRRKGAEPAEDFKDY